MALLQKRLPGMHVVVVAVLPRGWAGPEDFSWPNQFTKVDIYIRNVVHVDLRFLCASMHPIASCRKLPRCGALQSVDFVNEHMATTAARMANVTFVDCIGGFMARGKINSRLMPDALHPNPAGADAAHVAARNC